MYCLKYGIDAFELEIIDSHENKVARQTFP